MILLPENIIHKILLMAMGLQHLNICNEIKNIKQLKTISMEYYGPTFGQLPYQLQLTYEIVCGGAPTIPDTTYYTDYQNYEKKYKIWKKKNRNNMFWKSWPNSSIRFLL